VRTLAVVAMVLATAAPPALTQRSEQSLPLAFNQGIARVEGGWILSGTNSPLPGTDVIERVDDDLNVVTALPLAIPTALRAQGYNHVGDIDVVGNVIYAPFEQPDYDLVRQVTARYDATTLAFLDSVELAQHENSFVTVDEATMTAYSMDHFDGDTLQRYDVSAGWAPLVPLQLTMTLQHTQGADIAGGAVWIATSDDHNGVYRVDIATGETTSVGTLGHQGAEGEGIDATALPSGAFHALVNDPAAAAVHLGHYDLVDGTSATTATTATTTSTAPGTPSTGATSGTLPKTGGRESWSAVAIALLGLGLLGRWAARRRQPTMSTGVPAGTP
jgi:LPXTG-motif cell wall-anchored protein